MKKIVLFGDSIMAGFHDGVMSDILTDAIQKNFPKDEVINVSIPGYKTSNAVTRVEQDIVSLKPDIVILGFGANDISTTDEIKPGKFSTNLSTMIETIGTSKVILLSPPYTDWVKNPTRPWTRQLQFELVTEHLAKQMNVSYIDLLHQMTNRSSVNDLLQKDGLHFTKDGYILLESKLVPEIKATLVKQNELVSN
ncbi:SGNH/GDSL hydrolase family protein [Companilactobacillus jidongensis]|uniref:SGNH/GDSL hydrolase family protein n=1 Tax=Companilactobacillus jidongensis TaxID=2486006 RepID=UPI000F7977AC|nr:GDSL-type esterase/lipase family protein [Companilactobacillus jidongensis]